MCSRSHYWGQDQQADVGETHRVEASDAQGWKQTDLMKYINTYWEGEMWYNINAGSINIEGWVELQGCLGLFILSCFVATPPLPSQFPTPPISSIERYKPSCYHDSVLYYQHEPRSLQARTQTLLTHRSHRGSLPDIQILIPRPPCLRCPEQLHQHLLHRPQLQFHNPLCQL